MVVIVNGYVSLSELNTGFLYIVAVNVGACVAWGFIDGFLYLLSSTMELNASRILLRRLRSEPDKTNAKQELSKNLDGTFLQALPPEGRNAVAEAALRHLPDVGIEEPHFVSKKVALGGLSIFLIYLSVGVILSLPFLLIPNKVVAWLVSNSIGIAWLFWFGAKLGQSAGRSRWLSGLVLAVFGIVFLALSYFVWT
jgi:VIT1/CCC1 family predicted Fe2+/Mn2+ transporter